MNNIGIFYNEKNTIQKSDLMEISNISVMITIFNLYPEYKIFFYNDCQLFIKSINSQN